MCPSLYEREMASCCKKKGKNYSKKLLKRLILQKFLKKQCQIYLWIKKSLISLIQEMIRRRLSMKRKKNFAIMGIEELRELKMKFKNLKNERQ